MLRHTLIAACATALCGSVAAAPSSTHPAVLEAKALLQGDAASAAHVSTHDTTNARDAIVDTDGTKHVRFERRHHGLPVIGGDFVVHMKHDGKLDHVSQSMKKALAVDPRPSQSAEQAVTTVRGLFTGEVGAVSAAKLVVYARRTVEPLLAYEVRLSGRNSNGSSTQRLYYLDANTLQLIATWEDLHTAAAPGTGSGTFSGTVPLTTDSLPNGSYALRDPTRGNHTVYDLKYLDPIINHEFVDLTVLAQATLFVNGTNIWGDSTTRTPQSEAVDAMYGQNETWDYYKAMFGRLGPANDGRGASSYVRAGGADLFINALWGGNECLCMLYGFPGLEALDVVGHELTHGVTENTANLIYEGESGGLNESMSDIFGTMVEYAANNPKNKPNYLIGERIFGKRDDPDTTSALRYMFKPSLDLTSPDCYSPTLGQLDPHYSSGTGNHFYYLLAEGSVVPSNFASRLTTADLICQGKALVGIGRDAAARIVYRALTVYMTSDTNYADARAATLHAAKDLYRANSPQHKAVAKAWDAVRVSDD